MVFQDCRGNAVTASSAEAVARLDAAVEAYLGLRTDPGERLKEALAADPALAMGHVLRGCFFLLFANRELVGRAVDALVAAEKSARERPVAAREHDHIAALAAWANGDPAAALERWQAILLDHPRDILALKLSEFWLFYLGRSRGMRDSIGRVWPEWGADTPGRPFLAGMYAFALEEAGAYDRAEALGREAVALNPEDVWAAHAVAHVMEMTGRPDEGIAWITGLAGNWGAVNNFAFHLWWHRALFHWDRGEFDAVLGLYDSEVRAESTGDYLDISNAASLLLRLEIEGVDVGARWDELAERADQRRGDHMLAFADAHYAMARPEDSAFLEDVRRFAAESEDTEAQVHASVGADLCEAMQAFRRGDAGRTVELLWPRREAVRRVGGSHAQRDVFALALIEAVLRAGRPSHARALLDERLERRPGERYARDRRARLPPAAPAPG